MKDLDEKGSGLTCQVCRENVPKYTCPGCERRTCSLECVQEHKKQYSCTGKRERTAFVKREDLSHKTLVSDYKLLEEVERIDDVAKRSQPPVPRRQLPAYLKSLVYQAKSRDVDLRLVAPGMKKRKDNTTRYDGRSQSLSWRIEWRFQEDVSSHPPGQPVIVRHNTRVHENEILQKILNDHYRGEAPQCDVYMRQEGAPANEATLLPVDLSSTLGEFLKGKVIIEYPVLLCITKELPQE